MAKKYGGSKVADDTITCAWPLCDIAAGLVTFIRRFDFEPFLHCGQHHVIVTNLDRIKQHKED